MTRNGAGSSSWARRLGHARFDRDESAAQLARAQHSEAMRAAALSTDRWVAIVAAIKRHVDAYNTEARRPILNVEEPAGSTVTLSAGPDGSPCLTVTLEGTFVSMEARDGRGVPHATGFRLCPERSDDATAAYVLQNWMEHL